MSLACGACVAFLVVEAGLLGAEAYEIGHCNVTATDKVRITTSHHDWNVTNVVHVYHESIYNRLVHKMAVFQRSSQPAMRLGPACREYEALTWIDGREM